MLSDSVCCFVCEATFTEISSPLDWEAPRACCCMPIFRHQALRGAAEYGAVSHSLRTDSGLLTNFSVETANHSSARIRISLECTGT